VFHDAFSFVFRTVVVGLVGEAVLSARWHPGYFRSGFVVYTPRRTTEASRPGGLFTALRRQGVASEALVFPDEGHFVLKPLNSKRWHEAVFGWMKKWLER
jgi:Prolyl oligopeptidase family